MNKEKQKKMPTSDAKEATGQAKGNQKPKGRNCLKVTQVG